MTLRVRSVVRICHFCPECGGKRLILKHEAVAKSLQYPTWPLEGSMKTTRGFSLLELLIVVAIILIIATIAIPSLLKSRQAANESAAVSNVRNLNTAEVS